MFRVDSYLVNPRIVVTQDALLTGKGELRFDAPGPLVELLGLGAVPQSPIAVNPTDALNLSDGLQSLEFRADIHYVDAGESTVMCLRRRSRTYTVYPRRLARRLRADLLGLDLMLAAECRPASPPPLALSPAAPAASLAPVGPLLTGPKPAAPLGPVPKLRQRNAVNNLGGRRATGSH